MEINDLHKAILNFEEQDHNRERTPQEPREISRKIVKINDLHTPILNIEKTSRTGSGRQSTRML